MATEQGRQRLDEIPEDGDPLRRENPLAPREPAPETDDPDEFEPDEGDEVEIPDREMDPDEDDSDLPHRE